MPTKDYTLKVDSRGVRFETIMTPREKSLIDNVLRSVGVVGVGKYSIDMER